MTVSRQELLIHTIGRLLLPCRSVAVGASSPIPGAGALLARHWAAAETPPRRLFLTILGSRHLNAMTSGGVELFDMAAQGRIDAFFLGGGQIDGEANINLVGAGGTYPQTNVRWPGSFGSAYLYYLVPRVILFREEHSRRVMVPRVDFVSAPGPRADGVYRPGGPVGLLTNLCWFSFDRRRRRFVLETVHPGHTVEEVRDNTGFDFDIGGDVRTTAPPDAATLETIRGPIARQIAEAYRRFVAQVFPTAA
ncbi:glutaconate CoA-transferase subunit B [Enhydrobacter aerosaccus]|uniref:Glutaconate CoA-transferase subunit B n=1 Tax=Enhydrobacter aerosaccus TaxID=225324 RepID=A0A1T4RXR6_9HYPH|nr:CoA-transferase [Enhydrobacter aerosaccus]SKA20656.1 glutaconate CoA-transferase subunit B [Enhydrobacter aerosaccus]